MIIGSNIISSGLVTNGELLQVVHGGIVEQTTVNSSGRLQVVHGGSANNTTVNSSGIMTVASSGKATNTVISGGALAVNDSGTVINTTIRYNGYMRLGSNGGTASNVTLEESGRLIVSNGCTVTGELNITGAGRAVFYGGFYEFNLTGRSAENDYLVNKLSKLQGANYYLTINANQAAGTYKLAAGAANFSGSISVYADSIEVFSLQLNSTTPVLYNNKEYTLTQTDGNLTLSVQATAAVFVYQNGSLIEKAIALESRSFAASGLQVHVSSGGVIADNHFSSQSELQVFQGGVANTVHITSGAVFNLSGGTANDTVIRNGIMSITSNGIASNTHIVNGSLYIQSGGRITGQTYWEPGTLVSAAAGAIIDMNIVDRAPDYTGYSATGYSVYDLRFIQGTPTYTITTAADQACGEYRLAAHSNNNYDFYLTIDSSEFKKIHSNSSSVTFYDRQYTLSSYQNGPLVLRIESAAPAVFIYDSNGNLTSSGAYLKDAEISNYTSMLVETDGSVYNTLITSGGTAIIHGSAINTAINANGSVTVAGNGTAEGVNINSAGKLLITHSGSASAIVLQGFYANSNTITLQRGYAQVSAGGKASDIQVNSGGHFAVTPGGYASGVSVNSCGRLTFGPKCSAADITVSSGGLLSVGDLATTITQLKINSGAIVGITVGSNTYIQGDLNIQAGLIADSTAITGSTSLMLWSGASGNNLAVADGGVVSVLTGAELANTTVNAGGQLAAHSGAVANTTVNSAGQAVAMSDGIARATTIASGGRLTVSSSGLATDTIIQNAGSMVLQTGGTASNTIVSSGGYLALHGIHTGYFNIDSAATIKAAGGTVDMDLRNLRPGNPEVIITNIHKITGTPVFTVTVSEDQAQGTYYLATGGDLFTGTITVTNGSINYGTLALGETLTLDNQISYSLTTKDNELRFTIKENKYPDLQISSAALSSDTVDPGEIVTLTYTVTNSSSIASAATYVSVYNGDVCLAREEIAALAGNSDYQGTIKLAATEFAAGTHDLQIVVDHDNLITEVNENNNSNSVTLTVQPPRPDLEFVSFSAQSAIVEIGQAVQLNFTIKNTGDASASYNTAYLLNGDKVIGQVNIGPLAAGMSYSGSYSILASRLATGNNQITMVIDAADKIDEINKNNNTAVTDVTITTPKADLLVTAFTSSASTAFPNDYINLYFTVKNNGTRTALASYADIFSGDINLGRILVGSLDAGNSYSGVMRIMAGKLTDRLNNLTLIADATNRADESNEENNTATATITLLPQKADLQITEFACDVDSASIKQTVTLNYTVKNTGAVAALASYAEIFCGDISLGRVLITSLPAGAAYSNSLTFAASKLPLGKQTLTMVIDTTNRADEINENNNSAATGLEILPVAADLQIATFNCGTATASLRQAVTLSYTVKNTGSATALSTYADIFCDGTLLARVLIASLAAGAAYSDSFTISPGKLPVGKHTFTMTADASNRVNEISKDNNSAVAAVEIQPLLADLQIMDFSVGSESNTVISNEILKLSYTVKNTGSANTLATHAYIFCGETIVGQLQIAALTAGAAFTGTYNIAASRLAAGEQTLTLLIDATNRANELNEENNSADINLTVTNPAADLQIANVVSTVERTQTSQTAVLSFEVKNTGTAHAASSYVYIYRGNEQISQIAIGNLAAGTAYSKVFSYSVNDLSAGPCQFTLIADAGNQIVESNENNNLTSTTVYITAPAADLQVLNAAASASSITADQALTLSFTVKNTGNLTAAGSIVYIYDNDNKIGQLMLSSIQSQSAYTASIDIAPGQLSVGLHNLQILADADNRISELDEQNNSASVQLWVSEQPQSIAQAAGQGSTANTVTDTWELLGGGDFDGNSTLEWAWLNNTSGQIAIADTADEIADAQVLSGSVDIADWSLCAITDSNADGTDDLVWCSNDSSRKVIWQIENKQLTAQTEILA